MSIPDKIKKLIETFDYNLETYKKGSYNETQVRLEFINPFFKELGWDITNKQGHAEAYKEVIHEDAIKIGGVTKAPDYCFRIGGTRKFFLEAKKPAVNIKEDIHPAYQLRRYGWSAKLPLSILTDFEEFAVYDCRVKPAKTDKVSHSRIIYMRYTDYIERWDELVNIFSPNAILKGSFDKYVKLKKTKKGTAEVDKAFLQEIERWRELLARNIALRNPDLTQRELNFAVQQTIDRVVFLRICEDRGIENYGRLMALKNGNNVYKRLFQLFRKADDKYNSGLFHFKKEKDRDNFDNLTPSLTIDDKTLKDIFKNLYYPDSPYEFSVLPADILGQVYEQFLGKIIRLTPKHQAKIEEKPEVRKAGGVYYTPTYIVDYIVKNTVGKLLEGKKPGPRGGVSNLRILDPACGSGSFLIGAYQFLLDWHRDQYVNDGPKKWAKDKTPRLYQSHKGEWRLTTDERKRILLNNIYGVDIDHQAVEVTKLSLLLKVLEGEDEQSIGRQIALFQERVLPDLANNIKCGNSLIGPDFHENQQMSLLDEEEMYRVNSFDWNAEFPEIIKNGGFNAVIGNPPYIRIQAMKEWAHESVDYYKITYKTAKKGNYDIYVLFVEKGLNLLSKKGILGFILPHKFFNSKYGEATREFISQNLSLKNIVHFGFEQVFQGATTYTCLLFLSKKSNDKFEFQKVNDLELWKNSDISEKEEISSSLAGSAEWNFVIGKEGILFKKLQDCEYKLGDIANIFVGVQTSADSIFILDFVSEENNLLALKSKELDQIFEFEKDLFLPLVSGQDVNTYVVLSKRQYVLFPYQINDNKANLIELKEIEDQYPLTAKYLLLNKQKLAGREKGRLGKFKWHGYIYLKNMAKQNNIKLCVPRLVERLGGSFDQHGEFCLDNVDVGGVTLKAEWQTLHLSYLLAIINSKLMGWFFPFVSAPFRGGYFSANKQFLSQIPIKITDNPKKLIDLANQMLAMNKKLSEAKTPQAKDMLQRQIEATDKQIDQLVYKLYDLTEEEIKIVESET